MNCPRCGERMYGSVCPRCGNVVLTNRTSSTSRPTQNRNNEVIFMDRNGGNRAIKPKNKKKKSSLSTDLILKLVVVVLAVLCVVFFALYRSASGKLSEAQATINTQNESIKSQEEEITKLKEQNEAAEKAKADDKDNDGKADDSPSVEFDENGNVINITENAQSDSSDSEDNSEDSKKEYKSGDVYTIKAGDTGSAICKNVYGEYKPELWEKLLSANGMTASSQFHPGDELKIP